MDQSHRPLTYTDARWHFDRWEFSFVVAYALGVVLVWSVGGVSESRQVAVTAVLSLMGAWWWGFGRRLALHGDETWRGVLYLVVVLALFVAAVDLVPVCSWVLFGLCPQPLMVRPQRESMVWVAGLNVVAPLWALIHPGSSDGFWSQLAVGIAATTLSYIVVTSIDRIAAESDERAMLIDELEASRARIGALSREAGMTAERERLAAEIHDTLAQGFTSVLTLVQAARSAVDVDSDRVRRHLDLAAETARENLAEARALVGALGPAPLDAASLAEALHRQADRFAAESGIAIDLTVDDGLGRLSTPAQVALLRAMQEALANVRRHSGARSVSVRLARDGGGARLEVRDDGSGFDPDAAAAGFGLRGMRARVEQIGGAVAVHSGPGGTMVRVGVPA